MLASLLSDPASALPVELRLVGGRLLWLALLSAAVGTLGPWLAPSPRGSWLTWARLGVAGLCLGVLGAASVVAVAVGIGDTSLVWASDRSGGSPRPLWVLVALLGSWDGQGLLLLVWIAVLILALSPRLARDQERGPLALSVLLALSGALAWLALSEGPLGQPHVRFTIDPPPPLAHHPTYPLASGLSWLLGVGGLAVPFALLCAAPASPPVHVGLTHTVRLCWLALTVHLVSAAAWAQLLGLPLWLGDPGQLAALGPWLATTGLLHALGTPARTGHHSAWITVFALLALPLALLGTAATRSGWLSNACCFSCPIDTLGWSALVLGSVVLACGVGIQRGLRTIQHGLRTIQRGPQAIGPWPRVARRILPLARRGHGLPALLAVLSLLCGAQILAALFDRQHPRIDPSVLDAGLVLAGSLLALGALRALVQGRRGALAHLGIVGVAASLWITGLGSQVGTIHPDGAAWLGDTRLSAGPSWRELDPDGATIVWTPVELIQPGVPPRTLLHRAHAMEGGMPPFPSTGTHTTWAGTITYTLSPTPAHDALVSTRWEPGRPLLWLGAALLLLGGLWCGQGPPLRRRLR